MKQTDSPPDYRRIDFSPPDITELEIKAVTDVLRSGWITTGPVTGKLEERLASFTGTAGAVCLSSATAAEELILRLQGIGPGDEVIVPAYTYSATASAVIHTGARAVFVDAGPDGPQMDYDAVERAVTPATKAIIPVDLGGVVCDYDRLYGIVEGTRKIFRPSSPFPPGQRIQEALGRVALVADCAHALGARLKSGGSWRQAGSLADFSFFSFHAVKNLTTAEGGAVVWRPVSGVDDREIYRLLRMMSLHGQSRDALAKTGPGGWEYDIVAPWYKCNMTDIQAALGLAQLERYPELLGRRLELADVYDRMLEGTGVWHTVHRTGEMVSSGHLYRTRVPGAGERERKEIIMRMAERGVSCNVHYRPLPLMTGYRKYLEKEARYPNAVRLYENEITLPLHTRMDDSDVQYAAAQYLEIVKDCVR